MRKMMLIGAMVLLSAAAAQAGETRSLSLSSADRAAITPAKPVEAQRTADVTVLPAPAAPQAAAPAPAPVAAAAPAAAPATAAAAAPAQPQAETPRRRHAAREAKPRTKRWTEARIVHELHRHGIYW